MYLLHLLFGIQPVENNQSVVDKGPDGHRGDTIPICNAIIQRGWECYPIQYTDSTFWEVEEQVRKVDGYLYRVNPGVYEDVTQEKLEMLLKRAGEEGVAALPPQIVMETLGSKNALVHINHLSVGLNDTAAYYSMQELLNGLTINLAKGSRVLKPAKGSQGEGVWVCSLVQQDTRVHKDSLVKLVEAVDNHEEVMKLEDLPYKFEQLFLHGDHVIDQKFLKRISEGEVRLLMIQDQLMEIVHKKPKEGGISATLKSGAKYVTYPPNAPEFKNLVDHFLSHDLNQIMPAIGLQDQSLPLIWTADFIPADEPSGDGPGYAVGEFNCSCVGITQQLHLASVIADAAIATVLKHKLTLLPNRVQSVTPQVVEVLAAPLSPLQLIPGDNNNNNNNSLVETVVSRPKAKVQWLRFLQGKWF
eukprot:TRINITY_DN447_c0_g1_i5.p1 TRINITY_DN447_c0_g1~~TRINITY_DN447_c0_g1_i5.p1  ORF type:complete len:415 (-),score=55.92 TRINITY_DN447_c0_g1_i5:1704-2948(-)